MVALYFDSIPSPRSKIEKVPRGIRGEKSSKDMASSRNLVSTIGALASPKMGDGTRCPNYEMFAKKIRNRTDKIRAYLFRIL